MCPRGDLNRKSSAISPDRGNHATKVTGAGAAYPGIPQSVRCLTRHLARVMARAAGAGESAPAPLSAAARLSRPAAAVPSAGAQHLGCAGAADRGGPGCGPADVADLALGHQLGQRADSVLDRGAGVDAVLVLQVDVAGAQPPEGAFGCGADVCRAAVEDVRAATRVRCGRTWWPARPRHGGP